MSRALEFNTRPMSSAYSRETHDVATFGELPTPDIVEEFERLSIDGEPVEIGPEVVKSVAAAMSRVRVIIEARHNIMTDCYLFGTLLTGGTVTPEAHHRDAYPYTMQGDYRTVSAVDQILDSTRVLEPTILGYRETEDGPFEPSHMMVRISPELPYFVQKFGSSVLGITDLETAAAFYDCDFAGAALNFDLKNAQGQSLLRTSAPDYGNTPECSDATLSLIANL